MRYAWTHKLQLSCSVVYSVYCAMVLPGITLVSVKLNVVSMDIVMFNAGRM